MSRFVFLSFYDACACELGSECIFPLFLAVLPDKLHNCIRGFHFPDFFCGDVCACCRYLKTCKKSGLCAVSALSGAEVVRVIGGVFLVLFVCM